ncbi:hypothetical protein EV356DRAFT_532863 [Viridothelium virens]|uniref:Uncharacterized protein n=1 Tax=Viridothelium virens TaxID=1048519 RepID=A0A6A6H8G1_VIRVR|nr:hypothetical protein EV356DRAFT_532863 [Viridothelium virens]
MSKELSGVGEKLPAPLAAQVEKQLGGAIEQAKAARITQEQAENARKRASEATDPAERRKLEEEVKKLEKTAKSQVKMAQRLESGVWQGAGAGIGIGAATGMGLGTVVGMVLGAVTAVPTTLLGGLVGTGTGAIHGPWIKLGAEEGVTQGLAEGQKHLDNMQTKVIGSNSEGSQQGETKEGEQDIESILRTKIAEAQKHGASVQSQAFGSQDEEGNVPDDDVLDASDKEVSGKKDPDDAQTQRTKVREPKAELQNETNQKQSSHVAPKENDVDRENTGKKGANKKTKDAGYKSSHDPLTALDAAEESYSSFASPLPLPITSDELQEDDSQQYKNFAIQGLGAVGKAFQRTPRNDGKPETSQVTDRSDVHIPTDDGTASATSSK